MDNNNDNSVDHALRALEVQADITKLLSSGLTPSLVVSVLKHRAELLLTLHSFANDKEEIDEQALLLVIKYASDQIEQSVPAIDPVLYTEAEIDKNVESIINTLKNDDFATKILDNNTTFLARYVELHSKYNKTVPSKYLFDELMTQIMDMFNANGVWKHI